MAEKIILPLDDETDDVAMRLTGEEARALHLLLSGLSRNDLTSRGLTPEQAAMIERVIPVTY
ncbi:hypothetical protein [Pseudomonas sp. W2Jun17]|uniref:hypothetical protein n=1 Tax=Pseudomonas sp. W2Jun17 TaxID=1553460 RepID=UPI002005A038|nr:hypothetical protein [Pseudomonas sp. W2Jun17]MCK3849954.1 hypothetical protein [Pseudomonas sp. W2Jun17]